MRMVVKCILSCLLVALVTAQRVRYDDHQIQRLFLENQVQLQAIDKMALHPGLILLKNVKSSYMDVIVSPERLPELDLFVRTFKLRREIITHDVQKQIDTQLRSKDSTRFDWGSYHDLNEMYDWMDSLALQYPNILETIIIGNSFEGRPLKGIKISYKDGNPGVFLESGIHANEWIGPATATWILNELLTSQDTSIRNIAENFDWHIFPSVNPDGFQYTHTTNRFWRKTRSLQNGTCFGVDANRNWNFHWMEGGASNDPCSGNYGGPSVFSEVETRSLSDYITSLEGKIHVYLSFHCYGQMLMFPYGYTKEHVPEYEELMAIGTKSAEALASRFGTQYAVGDIAETIYIASGSSLDWVYGNQNITLAFVYELRDVALLPPEEIIPTAQETLDSIAAILEESRR